MEEFNTYTLPNGIRCIHRRVHSAVVHCALTVNAGTRDELADEYGMAHLVEHTLFKGTERRRAWQVNCRLENMGGELNAFTTKEETVIHATTLRADFAKAAELTSSTTRSTCTRILPRIVFSTSSRIWFLPVLRWDTTSSAARLR